MGKGRRTYHRSGAVYVLDGARQFMVRATPEEYVRQDALDWLVADRGVPVEVIRTEFNQRRRKAHGRSDILVLAPGASDGDGDVIAVVECKAKSVYLTDDTFRQAAGYAEPLGARYIVLTNGHRRDVYTRARRQWQAIKELPTWRGMLRGSGHRAIEPWSFRRWYWRDVATPERALATLEEQQIRRFILGQDSPIHIAAFATNLFALFADDHERPRLPVTVGPYRVVEDLGRTTRSFGNAGGGSWGSECYRSFVIHAPALRSDRVVSLAVLPSANRAMAPAWGGRESRTYLLVAIDDEFSWVSSTFGG